MQIFRPYISSIFEHRRCPKKSRDRSRSTILSPFPIFASSRINYELRSAAGNSFRYRRPLYLYSTTSQEQFAVLNWLITIAIYCRARFGAVSLIGQVLTASSVMRQLRLLSFGAGCFSEVAKVVVCAVVSATHWSQVWFTFSTAAALGYSTDADPAIFAASA